MTNNKLYLLAADITLLLHVLFVIFVVFGLVSIFIGWYREWSWVRNPRFRYVHLVGIGIVVLQSWAGIVCPLTTLEMWFRKTAGISTYSGSFISHWMETLLYYNAPEWVFTVVYTLFASVVLASWFLVKPDKFTSIKSNAT